MYLLLVQCPSKRPGTALILFYAVCLLYVLSAVTFLGDFLAFIVGVSNNSICKNTNFLLVAQTRVRTLSVQNQIDSEPMLFRITIIQAIAIGCCDFLAQCILVRINHCAYHRIYLSQAKSSKIYRCWIVWGQNIRVVIIPSLLAIAYLGQSSYLHLISRF